MKRFVWFGLAALLCVFMLKVPTAIGQAVFGSIIGTVTDPQGNAVVGAKVTVTSVTKSFTYDTTTNESGNYSVTHLIPDTYKVHVEASGFKVSDVPSIVVSADTAASVPVQLQLGAVTQTVEVTSAVPQMQTDRADVDVQFNQQYIQDLPVLNRNFTSFELLSPGTQKLPGFNHAATENPQGGGQIEVNGQHFSGTNFELDGTDNQDPILGIIVVNPNLDAIAETKISLQDYDAESGKATSGIIMVQTKSGSNEFHGSGFYYYRNSDQQARDPFTNKPGVPLAAATWKQYGGSIGGPIIKDKLFFFGDYQGTRQIQGITNLYTIPTANVIKSCNPATNAQSTTPGFCNLSEYLTALGSSAQIFDPTSSNTPDGSGRTAFANNMIPIADIKQNVGNILALFPAPTVPCGAAATPSCVTNNFSANGSGPFNQYSFDTREDWSAPHNFQVFGRFSLDYFNLSGTGGLGALGGAGFGPGGLNGKSTVHNYSLATGFTKAFGTNWLTDFRFGYFKYNPQTAYSDASQSPMDKFGIPGLNSGPGVQGPPETGGLSGFLFSGAGSISGSNGSNGFGDGLNVGRCNCPLTESEQQFQFVSNWTRTQGNHQIKFGADIRYAENLRVPSDASRTGLLNFDAGGTSDGGTGGLAIGTFLLGDVTSFQRFVSTSLNAAERQKRWFFYGQDSWRINPKFTMTYGLRWEIYFPESVNGKGNGGFANLDQGLIRVAGYGPIGLNGNIANTYKAFAPRLSFAYQFDNKTVLRIGYGRSFDIGVFGSNFGHVVTQNLPVLAQQSLQDTNCTQQPTCGLNTTNNRYPVFTLTQGPTPFSFTGILAAISSGGTLPLYGPDGTVAPRIRPTVQRLPTIDQWNATVQRQLTPTINLTVSYIGNKGTHLFAGQGPSYNNNEPAIGTGSDAYHCRKNPAPATTFDCVQSFVPSVAQPFRRKYFLNGVPAFTYPGFTTPSGAPLTCCAVDTGYFGNDADDKYNALQIKAEKRTSYGLQFLAHYTFSHAFDYDSNYFDVQKAFAWGPNPYNRNQVFVANVIYDLPIGKGKRFMSDSGRVMDYLIGGWQITNTATYGTGLPWTASLQNCGQVSDAGPCRPNLVSGQGLQTGVTKNANGTFWFSSIGTLSQNLPEIKNSPTDITGQGDSCQSARPTAGLFAMPACGQIGNAGFNTFRGPHAFYDDMSISKTFNVTERYKAEFRFDAYNVFNHPVLALPNGCVDCANGGQISDIEADAAPGAPIGMRQLQFGFRFTF
ncbi:MAG TPA: carboxypeptidase regulatory-like domain-containing protein [Candidatus Acidoferrum sp.]|nr:carboxypeptidase regulatory-like domain-containing protein [Candidatus Acidoferrum sp.]